MTVVPEAGQRLGQAAGDDYAPSPAAVGPTATGPAPRTPRAPWGVLAALAVIALLSAAPTMVVGDGMQTVLQYAGTLNGLRRPWTEVHNWAIWLNGPKLDQIAHSAYELAVVDYSRDGTAAQAFSADQIAGLRRATCQRRVLAYLSIGEAEDYRWYWRRGWAPGHPAWIVGEDGGWPGNYWVRYWDAAWRETVYRYLDRIIAAGFDGVYLDRVDAYAEPYARGKEGAMVGLVTALARYARARSPLGDDFGIVVQNVEDLGRRYPAFVRVVTGIGREETYVRATNRPVPPGERAAVEAKLDVFREQSAGRLVLTVDYADRPDLVRLAYDRSDARGYVPYVADVGLDRLRVNPGYAPRCHPLTPQHGADARGH